MGGSCSTHGRNVKWVQTFTVRNWKGSNFGNPDVRYLIILWWIWTFARQRLGKHVPKRYKNKHPLLHDRSGYHRGKYVLLTSRT
jgi:hypothetical protein